MKFLCDQINDKVQQQCGHKGRSDVLIISGGGSSPLLAST